MPGPSVYLANQMLNKSLRGVDWSPPANMYVALFTTVSETQLRANAVGSASEVANAGAYVRKLVTQAQIAAAAAGAVNITVDITFDTATLAWGTIYQAAIMDSVTWGAGNVLYFGPLSASANVQTGDVLKIPAATFIVGL